MNITYIHHSCFLVETERFYYLFDYEKGRIPVLDREKPVYVLSSHGHGDHYTPEVFSMLSGAGMQHIQGILSDDIPVPPNIAALQVSPGQVYELGPQHRLVTFRSTDLGVAFLIEDGQELIYHAGDLNDWVWAEETESYNKEMTENYRKEIRLLAETVKHRKIDVSFVVLDPRQEEDYDRGLLYFLENVPTGQVYPMHYWEEPSVIDRFLKDHPQYRNKIQYTERGSL